MSEANDIGTVYTTEYTTLEQVVDGKWHLDDERNDTNEYFYADEEVARLNQLLQERYGECPEVVHVSKHWIPAYVASDGREVIAAWVYAGCGFESSAAMVLDCGVDEVLELVEEFVESFDISQTSAGDDDA